MAAGRTRSNAEQKPAGPPPAQEVQDVVTGVLDVCIKKSFDAAADTSAVAADTDTLIRLFRRYDPDAKLAPSDLKATTLRQATEQVRDNLRDRDCDPADAQRLDGTLTSK
ncbi:MAG: hypothetical protein JWO74_1582 [Solirubrobacterales bacterium]|nr:hypothetical protein [Solirubrobacterales bacterium]